ncbi:hypothetical protein [Corynebacterium vitaeruminis]|uniref:hypothetical protein n=1 Tax=Corynebacterium vitaeruminis TaxID=38305 RepID=UPI0028A6E96F|nr:hypothetical protein [Corynebacterium vitaeruminis]
MNHLTEALDNLTQALNLGRLSISAQVFLLLSALIAAVLGLAAGGQLGPVLPAPSDPPATGIEKPIDASRLDADAEIKSTLFLSIAETRATAGRGPLGMGTDLESRAQAIAERNAHAGKYSPAGSQAGMTILQSALPYDQASAGAFITALLADPASNQALGSETATNVGIGVASAEGQTWVVVALS